MTNEGGARAGDPSSSEKGKLMPGRTVRLPLVLCLIAGTLVGMAPAAHAQKPSAIAQLEPNDTSFSSNSIENCAGPFAVPGTPDGCNGDYLSDKIDGVDARAHLTAVAAPETTQVTWYVCPLGSAVVDQTALSSCSMIGTDNTPSQGIASLGPPVDEAYDVTWDIPNTLDHSRRDVVALACIGSAQQIEGGAANCEVDEEDSIFLEDAQTGDNPASQTTSSGQFGRYRTRRSCFKVAPGDAACDAAYKAFPHGSVVPSDHSIGIPSFEFRAFTSDDVGVLLVAVNESAGASHEPDESKSHFDECTLEQTFDDFKQWRCIPFLPTKGAAEYVVSIINRDREFAQPSGTGGYCNANNNPNADTDKSTDGQQAPPSENQVPGAHDDCVLDVHYVVSSARQAQVSQSLYSPPTSGATACDNPVTDETVETSTAIDVAVCLRDQFGDPFAGPWTEETTGVGSFTDCGAEGSGHDHNADGVLEDCVGSTGPDGVSFGITVQNPLGPAGEQTLTSCQDPQNETTLPPVPNHGCADAIASLRASLKVDWIPSGEPTQSISGQVTDPAGQPVPGASVRACRVKDGGGNPASGPCLVATSDFGGEYTVGPLPEGEYAITATPPDSRTDLSPGKRGPEVITSGNDLLNKDVALTLRNVSGRVTDPDGQPVSSAGVQICRVQDALGNQVSGPCVYVISNAIGGFSAGPLPDGVYVATANPPSSALLLLQGKSSGTVVTESQVAHIDVTLSRRNPPPPGTTVVGGTVGDDGFPRINRGAAITVHGKVCPFDSGTATLTVPPGPPITVSLMHDPNGPAGSYVVTLPAPNQAGPGEVVVTVICLNGSTVTERFDLFYIDPSGVVVDTNGALLKQATVTLFRSDAQSGPFVQVPDQDVIMSPSNRTNPDLTDAVGHFGWDVFAGFYVVRAKKSGCASPDDPARSFVETEVLEIPPPVTDLVLVLKCPKSVFASKVTLRKSPGRFKGRVRSRSERCVEHRRVILWKKRPGRDEVIDKKLAGAGGAFRFRRHGLREGHYYARAVGRREPGMDGTRVICTRAASRNLRP